jgi:3-deoxy-7-phosphoheptulonate synthase
MQDISTLISPDMLRTNLAAGDTSAATTLSARQAVSDLVQGVDDRLLVIVGPCSLHDPDAGLDYAAKLVALHRELACDLFIVMRTYFEKPRTTVGWKGLINDPYLDGSHDIGAGLRMARQFLLDVTALGLPAGCEFLNPMSAGYLADIVSWGSIGARTTESQIHRELASGLPMPIGFKNSIDGDPQTAVDACRTAASGHVFLGMDSHGRASVLNSRGNPACHLVLRGGRSGPNYEAGHVEAALAALAGAGMHESLVIDASHGNSGKDHHRQSVVASAICDQVGGGGTGIVGVMLESFLVAGRQDAGNRDALVYGQSVTDACMDFSQTTDVLADLAESVRKRRAGLGRASTEAGVSSAVRSV